MRRANTSNGVSRTANYNCIAFAASETDRWWWPAGGDSDFWPAEAPREESLPAFVAAFESLGYQICSDGNPELGYDKVVLYALDGRPKHAARQERETAMWLSKLGPSFDIAHYKVEDLGGDEYGEPVCYLRKPTNGMTV